MQKELQFKIFINTKLEIWQDEIKNEVNSHVSRNIIEILRNEDFDFKLVNNENGFLHYEYEVLVYPIVESNLNDQLLLCNKLINCLKSKNVVFEIVSAFEHLL